MEILNSEEIENVFEINYLGYKIIYHTTRGILQITNGSRNLTKELPNYFIYNNFGEYMNHLYDNRDFMSGLEIKINELFDLTDKVHREDGMASCHISTYVFQSCAVYTQYLKFFNLYQNAIKFLIKILNFATIWENKTGKELHKGAIYGYLGEMFMHVLDYEMGFTYLHRSVKEDRRIKEFIPTYPEEAPSYKIMYLKGATDHFMAGYVKSVREDLGKHLKSFSELFTKYKGFDMASFDEVLVDNKFYEQGTLEDIKAQIFYCIWSRYYYRMKVSETARIIGTFDNLNRVNKLFTLCVNIEMLSKELGIKPNKKMKGAKVQSPTNREMQKELYITLGGTKEKFEDFFPFVNRQDDMIDQLIKDLLKFEEIKFNSIDIDPLTRCMMLYILIRNFTAHNVKSIDRIGNNFFEIYKALLYLLFTLLIESKNKGLVN